jgi:predicted transposase/invertase (TIGR01784 family)
MKHRIDPKIDCVFKALLGSDENRNLLVHFLNAVLAKELKAPIEDVEILNPYNDKEFVDDKLSIVDVKARDTEGRLFQVEIQLVQYGHLASRIVYGWADIYAQQLQSGVDYAELKPTYSIWLLDDTLISTDADYVHSYKLRDERGQALNDHGGIWLFEIEKFNAQNVASEEQRWIRFLKEGELLDDQTLPEWMFTKEMEQAMTTLRKFSEKERDYHEYQARQNFVREQRTIQKELEGALEREKAALEREQAALAENARLKALLEQQGKTH